MMNGIDCSKVTYRTVPAVCPPFLSQRVWIPFHLILLHLSVINGTASLSIKSPGIKETSLFSLKKENPQNSGELKMADNVLIGPELYIPCIGNTRIRN